MQEDSFKICISEIITKMKIKEAQVPCPEINPYRKSRKKDIVVEFLAMRLKDSEGCEGMFETAQDGVEIAKESGKIKE